MSKEPSAQLAEPSSAVSDNDVLLDESKRKEMFDGKTDESNKKFVEEFIRVLLSCRGVSKNVKTMDILRLAHTCKRIFESQARLIEIDGPVRICGDLHAQFPDLIRLFAQGGFPPDSNYLFLGDYVDRGAYNLEVLLLCLSYKASPFNLEEECLENDLMWSDPGSVKGWEPNTRGASFTFGEDVVHEYCKMLDIDLIVRGHQVVQDGYEFFANKKLVTVFSAPHYSGTFTNSAAVCKVSAGLEVSFEVLVPEDMKVQERKPTAEATAAEPTEN
ncbi:hypothetical protein L3Y34_000550 [Caenorhabditis briggsae]|uniref:Serine/threonine specific protein phosphatases domain-containing protein n=1 Tax=Caenorhabditis briggsae TaxID=6238 RepID=A0AAE9D9I5_CAEBR|nr:hypothetical protein L3Y34_000550 [Caenorhabditis briggsae]